PDRRLQLGTQRLVGVQAEDPVVAGLFDRELFLASEAVERALDHPGACCARELAGAIGGAGVDHDDLVAEGQRRQAAADAVGLVEADDRRRELGQRTWGACVGGGWHVGRGLRCKGRQVNLAATATTGPGPCPIPPPASSSPPTTSRTGWRRC